MRRDVASVLLGLAVLASTGCDTPSPPFERSGVIEGFYGPPWSHQDRLDVLAFMGRVGLTAYFYAPKNDPYHRARWRDPYPPEARAELQALIATAREHEVEFWYAISPGLDIVYSDSGDYDILASKLAAVGELGVSRFALFLDDVPPTLAHAADRAAFATLADAHTDLINRLHQDLRSRDALLVVTPTTYTGAWGDQDYVRQLGSGVDPEVPMFWTGSDVVSPEVTARQAREWGDLMGRPPLVWDNYPVNDFARWRLFLGPVVRRTSDLSTAVSGIIANPMNEAHASMIPLATLADYAREPAAYDAQVSLRNALTSLYGSEVALLLEPFVELFGDYSWQANVLEPLFIPGEAIDIATIEQALARLRAALVQLDSAAAGNATLAVLGEELEPFVTRAAERLSELRGDPAYRVQDGHLRYDKELDRFSIHPTATAIRVDGDLAEWSSAPWRSLIDRSGNATGRTQAAFRHDGRGLFIALRVRDAVSKVEPGIRVGHGDHVALVLQSDPVEPRRHLTPGDVVILLPAPTAAGQDAAVVRSMKFEGFMAKFLADNRALTFSEFHVSTFGLPPAPGLRRLAEGLAYASRPAGEGYTAELALPLEGRETLRLSLTVLDVGRGRRVYSLARRNYPANPATFSEIIIQR